MFDAYGKTGDEHRNAAVKESLNSNIPIMDIGINAIQIREKSLM